MMVSWVYAYVKAYQIIQFKYVQFTACQLHINNTEGFLKKCSLLKFKQSTALVSVQ